MSQDEKFSLQQVFKKYLSAPERCETVKNDSKISKLDIYCPQGSEGPRQFGWLVGTGLYYGQLPENDEPLLRSDAIRCPNGAPHDFLLTSFHVLLVYKTVVSVVSLLTHRVVFEDNFSIDSESDVSIEEVALI